MLRIESNAKRASKRAMSAISHPWSDVIVGCGTLFVRDGDPEGFHPEEAS